MKYMYTQVRGQQQEVPGTILRVGMVLFLWHPVWHTQPLYLADCSPGKSLVMTMFTHLYMHTHHTLPPSPIPLPQLTHVNLNYILCPALVDPFNGPYYRTAAVFHLAACLLTLGKLY